MSIVGRARKIKKGVQTKKRIVEQKLEANEDIQELKKFAKKGVSKYSSLEFQKELAARQGVGSPFDVTIPKKKKSKSRKQPPKKTNKQPPKAKTPKKDPPQYVKLYAKKDGIIYKYRVEYKLKGNKKYSRKWFESKKPQRTFANKKAKEIGVRVTNVQTA